MQKADNMVLIIINLLLKDAAFIHSYWLTEEVMEKRIPRKLKNFKDKKR